ncbi:MAG: low molecular weight protein arginine phosphatase [Tissierellia bacterium]|nr:low molecular weight protein arginine phosphatase [Tissierellia bacterium]
MNILFVCTGNTCRSPMAAALLQEMARKEGIEMRIKSAGIFAQPGQGAAQTTIEALKEDGIDIRGKHSTNPISMDLLEEADIILTMSKSHKESLIANFDSIGEKVFTLREYAYGVEGDIEDPFGGSIEVYRTARDDIKRALQEIISRRRYDESRNR